MGFYLVKYSEKVLQSPTDADSLAYCLFRVHITSVLPCSLFNVLIFFPSVLCNYHECYHNKIVYLDDHK